MPNYMELRQVCPFCIHGKDTINEGCSISKTGYCLLFDCPRMVKNPISILEEELSTVQP